MGSLTQIGADTWAWLADGGHWLGGDGIVARMGQHLAISVIAVVASLALAVPLGLALHGRAALASQVLRTGAAARAVPTLGMIALLGVLLPPRSLVAPVAALAVLAFPTLLTGVLSGVLAIPADIEAAGQSLGMTKRQTAAHVHLPMAAGSIVAATRTALLQVLSTATLCAYVRDVGLGVYLFDGLDANDMGELFGVTVVLVALVLVADLLVSAAANAVMARLRAA